MKTYLVDSNSLISPYRTFYQFDLVPSFWGWFKQTYDQSILLVDRVRDELCHVKDKHKPKDELQVWVENNCLDKGKIIHPNSDDDILIEYQNVLRHIASSPFYTEKSFHEWADNQKADPWLIAIAKANDYTIVTMEESNRNLNANNPTSKEPRIPDVCKDLNVECINLYDLMREVKCTI
ncbi:hypothetical protein HMI01_29420 [Halolactibacillus miurensis]|uniref:PIN domain-containing protein n=1 Tax=Halolactibacillus miurensis TaxID=306541 RepID=A0A1I6U2G4_9BACI|nr:DUF4411 family protein [Halolactibacillus miurensis]GEM05954.1 hypothetical protein HMI01_29420 [Halolactibacillus miurensis]SFS95584.1 protein of unknown function [Halolactibacillus miurensis]